MHRGPTNPTLATQAVMLPSPHSFIRGQWVRTGWISAAFIHSQSAWCAGAVNVISPFEPITREEAAGILKVSLSTLDNMVAAAVMPAPCSIPGSRRKYWHPDIFYP